jgi:hypothetical protein
MDPLPQVGQSTRRLAAWWTSIMRIRICVAAIACVSLVGCSRRGNSSDTPPINLAEVSAYPVPDSFPVVRALPASDGTVALISARWPHLLVGRGGPFAEFGAGLLHDPVGAALDEVGNVTEVVDAEDRAILFFDHGRLTKTERITAQFRPTYAVRSPTRGWYVAGLDAQGRIALYSHQAGRQQVRVRHQSVASDTVRDVALTLAPSGALIVTRSRQPHLWVVWRPGEEPIVAEAFDTSSAFVKGGTTSLLYPLWVGAGLVPAGKQFLYTLADLRSTDRRLLLMTAEGRLIRQTSLRAPMGFVGSVPGRPLIVAVRDINGQEVVTYQWQGGDESLSTLTKDGGK